jgi:hypothetical protein
MTIAYFIERPSLPETTASTRPAHSPAPGKESYLQAYPERELPETVTSKPEKRRCASLSFLDRAHAAADHGRS